MEGAKKTVTGIVISILAAIALLTGGFWILLSVVFFQNFYLPNLWHCFVLLYTFATPAIAVCGICAYRFRPSLKTALFTVVASLAVGATFFLWIAEGSRGLIH